MPLKNRSRIAAGVFLAALIGIASCEPLLRITESDLKLGIFGPNYGQMTPNATLDGVPGIFIPHKPTRTLSPPSNRQNGFFGRWGAVQPTQYPNTTTVGPNGFFQLTATPPPTTTTPPPTTTTPRPTTTTPRPTTTTPRPTTTTTRPTTTTPRPTTTTPRPTTTTTRPTTTTPRPTTTTPTRPTTTTPPRPTTTTPPRPTTTTPPRPTTTTPSPTTTTPSPTTTTPSPTTTTPPPTTRTSNVRVYGSNSGDSQLSGSDWIGRNTGSIRMLFSNLAEGSDISLNEVEKRGGVMSAKMFKDESCLIGVWDTGNDVFVDLETPRSSWSGLTARNSFINVIPRSPVGSVERITLFLRQVSDDACRGNVTIEAEVVESRSGRLGQISVWPGRLDPVFRPSVFAYYVRVPESAKHVTLNFVSFNDRDTQCTVDGKTFHRGRGRAVIPISEVRAFRITCNSGASVSGSTEVYLFTVVPQYGGETALADITVRGSRMAPKFDSFFGGPYSVDLDRETEWTQIQVLPRAASARVSVNGEFLVNSTSSRWLRIPKGEQRVYRIAVNTISNPVAEVYTLNIKNRVHASLWNSRSKISSLAKYTGLASFALASSHSSVGLLNSMKNVQSYAALGHSMKLPWPFEAFTHGLIFFPNRVIVETEWFDEYSSASSLLVPENPIADELRSLSAVELGGEEKEAGVFRTVEYEYDGGSLKMLRHLEGSSELADITSVLAFRWSFEESLRSSITTMGRITVSLLALGFVYAMIWFVYLSDISGEDHVYKRELDVGMVMRSDFPLILHPVRFWSYILDLALIEYVDCAVTILLAPPLVGLSFMGFNVPIVLVRGLAVAVLISSIGYIIWGSLCLLRLQSKINFSSEFCEYQDQIMTHGKAIWRPKWTRYLPLFRSIFEIEIDSVAPIQSDPNSSFVQFSSNKDYKPLHEEDGDLIPRRRRRGACFGLLGSNTSPKGIVVSINDLVYTDISESYDKRNTDLIGKYSEAKLGEVGLTVRNSYGYLTKLRCDLNLGHLSSLMQIMDNFPFWLPKKNCQLNYEDQYYSLFNTEGGFYLDWSVNRALILIGIVLKRVFSTTGVFVFGVCSLMSFLCRIAGVFEHSKAKYVYELKRWNLDIEKYNEEKAAVEGAQMIWPFTEIRGVKYTPSFSEYPPSKPSLVFITLTNVISSPSTGDLLLGAVAMIMNFVPTLAICLALASMVLLVRIGNISFEAFTELMIYQLIAIRDFFFDIQGVGARVSYFFEQVAVLFSGQAVTNWHFPKSGNSIRRFPVSRVDIISNELGIQFNSKIEEPLQHNVPNRHRLEMHKTLVVYGSLGQSRREMYSSMPIQIPFCSLFTETCNIKFNNENIDRCVATIQIVNHTYRANISGLSAIGNNDHDSFLSLYANEDYFPTPGKIRLRTNGHNYSVRYDPENSQLVVRGPAIYAGTAYTLRTSTNQPSRSEVYRNSNNDAISEESTELEPTLSVGKATAVCDIAGTLRVPAPSDNPPDLYKSVQIITPSGSSIVINPQKIRVHYDIDCGELFLRHEDISVSQMPYRVSWPVRPKNPKPIHAKTTATHNGTLFFHLNVHTTPDLRSWLTLRDSDGATVDIDPSQTDAYQFFLPEQPAKSFFEHAVRTTVGRAKAVASFIAGHDNGAGMIEEPIPCTVIQCVNPAQRIFRVDPDFHEVHRVFVARLHEFRAKQKALEAESLSSLWITLMQPHEYVRFWSRFRVNIVDGLGNIVDPLGNPKFDNQFKEIALGDHALRQELSHRVDNRCEEIEKQMDQLRVWIRGYEDTDLHTAQLRHDLEVWAMHGAESIESGSLPPLSSTKPLADIKSEYMATCPSFIYPCNIPDVFIGKRPNLSAQFRIWSDIVQSWLLFEEGCDITPPENKNRISMIVRDLMQSLKYTIYSNEVASLNAYRSILHYVIGSHNLRGMSVQWSPDSFRSHPSSVRAWTLKNGKPDFDSPPERIPCLLRLTPNALQILMCNGGDLSKSQASDLYPWQKNTGLYIPLLAFRKFELRENSKLTADAKPFENMTTKLVCRKNINVDDSYVRRIESDQIGNDITFDDIDGSGTPMKFVIMLGHSIPRSKINEYQAIDEVCYEESCCADTINIHPLTFNFSAAFTEQWKRAIKMAGLDTPHGFEFDGVLPEEDAKLVEESESRSSSSTISDISPRVTPPEIESPLSEYVPTPVVSSSEMQDDRKSPHVIYRGEFQNKMYHGFGTLFDLSGVVLYEGQWKEGLRHGLGTFVTKDQKWICNGHYDHGEPVGEFEFISSNTVQPDTPRAAERLNLRAVYGIIERAVANSASNNCVDLRQFSLNFGKSLDGTLSETATRALASLHVREDKELLVDRYLVEDMLRLNQTPPSLRNVVDNLMGKWNDGDLMEKLNARRLVFADGSVYEGETVANIPHGKGRFYEGVYSHVYADGFFEAGNPNGYCVVEDGKKQPGNLYFGNFKRGKRHGEGIQIANKGKSYIQAIWKDDEISDGPVTISVKEEDLSLTTPFVFYEGHLLNGYPDTIDVKSKVIYRGGLVYSGGFKEGMRSGLGEFKDPKNNDEVLFIGYFKEDLPDGQCVRCTLPDGNFYCGNMSKGQRAGMGELYTRVAPSGNVSEKLIYEGMWFADRPHGRGIHYAADGEYDGEWKNGKRQGKGRFIYKESPLANGRNRIYEGDWDKDQPHGVGRYLSNNGVDNVYKLDKGSIIQASVQPYKPRCGRTPEITVQPTVVGSTFDKSDEKTHHYPWNKLGAYMPKQNFKQFLKSVANVTTQNPSSWSIYQTGMKPTDYSVKTVKKVSHIRPPMILPHEGNPFAEEVGSGRLLSETSSHIPILKVFLVEGRKMKMDSKGEPFVKIFYGSGMKQTEAIPSGGPNARFNKTFLFLHEKGVTTLNLEVWDLELVGRAEIDLTEKLKTNESLNLIVPLQATDKKGQREDRGQIVLNLFSTSVADSLHIKPSSSQSTNRSEDAAKGPHVRVTVHAATRVSGERGVEVEPFVRVQMGHKEGSTAVGSGLNIAYDESMCLPWNGDNNITFTVIDHPSNKKFKPTVIGTGNLDIISKNGEYSGDIEILSYGGEKVALLDVSVTLRK